MVHSGASEGLSFALSCGMISLILGLAVVGFLVYLVITYIPMPDVFKKVIVVIVAILLILYVLRALGGDIPVPSLR